MPPQGASYPFAASLTVEPYLSGVRIDSFLVRHFRNYTSWRMQRMVRAGQVRIEGSVAETSDRVYTGQTVDVRLLEPPDHLLPAEPRELEIVHEDPWLVVVNKPADLVVHPCGQYATGSLANALQAHLDRQTPLPGLVRPGIVHRLDRLTSGVIVLTKDHLAHRKLSIDFQESRISKSYLALVHGVMADDKGEVNLPIGNHPSGTTIMMSTASDALDPRAARTKFAVVQRFDRFTLVNAMPVTGRLHQIRVHMAALGHPVAADEFYSGSATLRRSELNGTGGDEIVLGRQALHAHTIQFIHPILRQLVSYTAPLAADIRYVVELLSGREPKERPAVTVAGPNIEDDDD